MHPIHRSTLFEIPEAQVREIQQYISTRAEHIRPRGIPGFVRVHMRQDEILQRLDKIEQKQTESLEEQRELSKLIPLSVAAAGKYCRSTTT